MSKIIILGAGASKACPYTRDHLPLPLLKDLPQILSTARLNPEAKSEICFGDHLFQLLHLVNDDVEALLTMLFRLNEYFFRPEGKAFLEADVVDRILASGAVSDFFKEAEDHEAAVKVLTMLRAFCEEEDQTRINFGPRNFFTRFQGALREYFQTSIYQQPCPLHLRLFGILDHRDCVASFNYDEIADYALWAARKLTAQSFEGLGFQSINLPQETSTLPLFVQFLKLHGSFNWFNQYIMADPSQYAFPGSYYQREGPRPCLAGGPEVHYYLGHEKPLPNAGNTPDPFLLPFHCKDLVYRSVPMFARHMEAFRRALQQSSEIWIVGKNFCNSDRELNGFIRFVTSDRERVLNIIDPAIDVEFHCELFNCKIGNRYQNLEEFGAEVGLKVNEPEVRL